MLQNGMLQGIFFQVSDVVHVPLVGHKEGHKRDGGNFYSEIYRKNYSEVSGDYL